MWAPVVKMALLEVFPCVQTCNLCSLGNGNVGTFHVPRILFQFVEQELDGTSFRTPMERDPRHGNHVWPLDGNLRPKVQLMEEKKRRGRTMSLDIHFIFVILELP